MLFIGQKRRIYNSIASSGKREYDAHHGRPTMYVGSAENEGAIFCRRKQIRV